jgi:hypothetical protein
MKGGTTQTPLRAYHLATGRLGRAEESRHSDDAGQLQLHDGRGTDFDRTFRRQRWRSIAGGSETAVRPIGCRHLNGRIGLPFPAKSSLPLLQMPINLTREAVLRPARAISGRLAPSRPDPVIYPQVSETSLTIPKKTPQCPLMQINAVTP